MTDGSPLTRPSLRAKRSNPGAAVRPSGCYAAGLQYDCLGCWRRACCGPWIASSQGLLAMTDGSPLTHPSLRAKRSNPGAAVRPSGLPAPRMLWPLDCFVARAPRNDGWVAADPSVIASEAKQSRGCRTTVWVADARMLWPWIASSQGLLAMTDRSPLTHPSLRAKRSKSQGLQYDRLGCWRRACCGPWIASSQCRKDERAAAIFPATLPLALAIQPCRSDRPPYSRRPPISLSRNPADIRATYA